jgi:hypothetical protein
MTSAAATTPAVDPFNHTAIDAVIFQAHNAQWDSVVGALAAGFQVNSVCSVTARGLGATLLHFGDFAACQWHGHLPMVRELLGAGADPNARSKTGATSVWRAARYGTAAALRELVEAGGDVNAADENGSTPLVTLVRNNVGDAAERLLVLLAAPSLDLHATSSGKSAVQWAREAGHHHLAELVQAEVRGDYLAGLDWFGVFGLVCWQFGNVGVEKSADGRFVCSWWCRPPVGGDAAPIPTYLPLCSVPIYLCRSSMIIALCLDAGWREGRAWAGVLVCWVGATSTPIPFELPHRDHTPHCTFLDQTNRPLFLSSNLLPLIRMTDYRSTVVGGRPCGLGDSRGSKEFGRGKCSPNTALGGSTPRVLDGSLDPSALARVLPHSPA